MSFQDLRNGGKSLTSAHSPSQAVAVGIFQINTTVAGFRRLVDAIGSSKDTPEHRQKLHNTRQRILELVKETSAKLKSLSDADRDSNIDPSKRLEDAKLARDFQTILQEFQKVQQLASDRESTYTPSAPSPSTGTTSGSGELLAATMEQENQPFLAEPKRQEALLMRNEIAFNEAIIEEREYGVKEIQDQIGEAREIFKDLAVLVHDQGIVIDDIQSNLEASASATIHSKRKLYKTSKSVKAKSSWCWWVLVVILVVLVILLVIIIL